MYLSARSLQQATRSFLTPFAIDMMFLVGRLLPKQSHPSIHQLNSLLPVMHIAAPSFPRNSSAVLGIILFLSSTTTNAFALKTTHVISTPNLRHSNILHRDPVLTSPLFQHQDDVIEDSLPSPAASTQQGRRQSNKLLRLRGGASAAAAVTLPHPLLNKAWDILQNTAKTILSEFNNLSNFQKGMFLAIFLLGIQIGRSFGSLWKRYTEAVDIPSAYFGPKAPYLKGRCVSVSDGDTIRFLHVPTPFHVSRVPPQPKRDKNGNKKKVPKVSEIALPIRVCTIDTPETAKFGKSGQPFGQEAKEYLSSLVDDKMISIRLLQKDQYGRAVAQVLQPGLLSQQSWLVRLALLPILPIFKLLQRNKCVDELLLREGLAEVYQGMGAVYGPLGKDKYLEIMEEAKKKKVGIWSLKNRESAAEYKKRTK